LSPPPRIAAFAPFQVRNFRRQWPADLLTSCAFEMETLVLGWYVLVETGSVVLLTLFGALTFVGTLVAPLLGVIGDRIGHRNLLCGMRCLYTLLSTTLMVIAFTGALSPMIVFVIAGLMGLVRPSDLGVRGALVADIVPLEHLVSAMAISRTTSDSARVAGALTGAGLFAAFGMGPTYVVVTGFYATGLLLTFAISSRRSHYCPIETGGIGLQRASHWYDLREGLKYVWSTPPVLAAIWLAVLVNLTAFPLSGGLLPYIAREVYRVDQAGLGYLAASFALGALFGSLAVSLRRRIRTGRMMIASGIVWYLALLAFAQMQSLAGGIITLMCAGFVQSFSMITLAVLLLRISGERFRGRIMGVRMLAIYTLPLGLLAAGVLIEHIGFAATATLYAVSGLLLILTIALRWRAHLWPLDVPANAR
jgi:MFS family permease